MLGRSRTLATDSIPDEDALAYFRDADEFRCTALVVAPNGDFAQTLVRLLVAATVRLAVFARLRESRDPVLAAIAAKGVHELAYHRDHAARWLLRLGDGTEESHRRAQAGVDAVWPLLADVFTATDVERRLTEAGVAVDPATTRDEVRDGADPGARARDPDRARLAGRRRPARPRRRARPGAGRAARHPAGPGPPAPGGHLVSAMTRRSTRGRVAATVTDPELPMLTLADLGVLRDVRIDDDGTVVVEITPTYTGCPAMGVMRADLVHALHRAGFGDVDVRTVLSPAWSTDWISEEGRRKLRPAASPRPGRRRSAPPARCR